MDYLQRISATCTCTVPSEGAANQKENQTVNKVIRVETDKAIVSGYVGPGYGHVVATVMGGSQLSCLAPHVDQTPKTAMQVAIALSPFNAENR
jgi:hypothetical protein